MHEHKLVTLCCIVLMMITPGTEIVFAVYGADASLNYVLDVPRPNPDPKMQSRISNCLRPLDSPTYIGDLGDRWSVSPSASVQIIKYDLATKKASLNKSLGAGASFHFYKDSDLDMNGRQLRIKDIKPECRATTFSAKDVHEDPENGKIAYSLFSITPTLYGSQDQGADFSVQPAVLVGAFRDLINVGAGFNLTGPEKGHVFLLFSIGAGF
jgi:hypothetical protein